MRADLAPGARFIFDVFNPNRRFLADADGVRRTRDALSFEDSDRGNMRVDVAATYDSAAQVTRGTWHFSADSEPDLVFARVHADPAFAVQLTRR
ncbi:MAG: hypothetical protein QM638_00660 [Nocardioides sp.]|uniref:hypothetical protein n=1 Tax=Nocardioides sp. TaxID=35761 RepID=UPI0039E3F6B5